MIATLAPDLRRIIAQNPSPLTGTGTNTYLLGQGDIAVIDPGPDLSGHLSAILAALRPDEVITHVLVTHTHLDHSALAPALARATGAVVMGFGAFDAGRRTRMQDLAARGLPDGGEGIDRHFAPDIALPDGAVIEGMSWTLRALHTPGHAASHLCFGSGDRLFSGDHMMGWSSSLISPPDGDMAAYMASLARLQDERWSVALPGHGPQINTPADRIAALVSHRRAREAALKAALQAGPLTLTALTAVVYTDTPRHLHAAARRNVLAHVIDLVDKNQVSCPDVCANDPIVTPT
jgi:glyoxylase-like metal-dependent hydrolase (beta-lactamase superfamily II)